MHLFEADDRLGGHAHTHDVAMTNGQVAGLDSAFLVHNDRTYPNLLRLFAELGVATQDSEMSMSVRCDGCGLEYAGSKGWAGCSPQRSKSSGRGIWRMWRRSSTSTGVRGQCWPAGRATAR